jgi:hypothetical protein
MGFDVHQDLFDEDGEIDEEAAEQYIEDLDALFAASPEWKALRADEPEPGWTGVMLHYAINYQGVAPPDMTAGALHEVIFDLFPRKVSCSPADAFGIVRELRAFWSFAGRELDLKNAEQCGRVLGDGADTRLARELANPANFGMAKSFFTAGEKLGFDMTSQEGINEWMNVHNAGMAVSVAAAATGVPRPQGHGDQARRKKRKLQRASRKKNRKGS